MTEHASKLPVYAKLTQVITGIIGLFFMLIVGSVFSTLGGLLGAAIFKKSVPTDFPIR